MASKVALVVGTKKGLFLLTSDAARDKWDLNGPFLNGNDINHAQVDLRTAPQTLIYPSVALSITVFAFVTLGEVLREALDPKARAQR